MMFNPAMSQTPIEQRKSAFLDWMKANELNVNSVSSKTGVNKQTLYSWIKEGKKPLGHEHEANIATYYDLPIDAIFGPLQDTETQETTPNSIAKWREHAKMDRMQMAKALQISESALELLERGHMPLSATWLRKLATVFRTHPGFIMLDPDSISGELLIHLGVADKDLPQAIAILDTFRNKQVG